MYNILIIDDHDIVVKGIQIILEDNFDEVNILSSSTFTEGISMIRSKRVDLVILDINVPGGGTTAMVSRILEAQPFTKVLICSGLSENDYCLNYLRVGANGYIHKNAHSEEYVAAVKAVFKHRTFVSPQIQEKLISMALERREQRPSKINEILSDREYAVARMIIQGKYTKEIAEEMKLKSNTISTFKKKILIKLGVTNAIELSHLFGVEERFGL